MVKEWELLGSTVDRDYRVFKIKTVRAISPRTKDTGQFYTIETNDWVNVIPVTENQEIVMIKQFRHGTQKITLEIPGGLVGVEHHKEAALRELVEETGYAGDTIEYLGAVNPNPAIFNNLCHTYLVKNARKVTDTNFDPDEDIDVVHVPVVQIPSLIENGIIDHALVVVAFHFYFSKTTFS
ncbi:MAG TPA: NUDIX hydrolase [Syntrophorhabdaceae bacterium]|jgi:8-oxo-dGTP pyrophosphatase MutT (NUDIX family)|nr:NUDIX hydrolase [Syntrophorhabdaceae bacterium]MDI9560450.1 NUDIX hydrolase [Pseudomonadota bacterium]OQC51040.1 MAG: ADP-ribose pyrophosphatase [Deltaproteobacteria bacterium ADurb.Bin026]MBP8698950.1 NUDIX hydrolase [Syntrophorhabdaceae bacterium]HOS58491.1 NUDIX hydrolase [Syntrophorhabdaceae bacterium]